MPHKHAGMVIINTCGIVSPSSGILVLVIVTNDTTAAAIGEHVIPTCDATDATAHGLSGLIPFFKEISAMIGISV